MGKDHFLTACQAPVLRSSARTYPHIYIPQDKGYRLQVSDLECQPQTHVIPNNSNPMCINQFVVIPDNHKNYFFLALQRIGIPFREHLFFNLFE